MNYEDRHPQATKNNLPWDHPIRWIMRDVCNLPDQPYDPNDPELMLIHYDELVEILERHMERPDPTRPDQPTELDLAYDRILQLEKALEEINAEVLPELRASELELIVWWGRQVDRMQAIARKALTVEKTEGGA